MAKPTFGPKEIFPGAQLISGTVPIAAGATAMRRNLEVVTLYASQTVAAKNFNIFRAPPSKARLTYVGVNCGAAIYRQATYIDGWKLVLINKSVSSTGGSATMSRNTPSLIGQTLAATSFKSLPINWGNGTLLPGQVLQLQLSVSGTPQTLNDVMVAIEWLPVIGT
ncbi:MAG: hypothetical protein KKG25_16365 [Bacteroidetes bacterium]|nr:hypothetical protein [Bacteroidota bacterium]MBU1486423.1 hypothetical protein [Bacteroidota bacterium]